MAHGALTNKKVISYLKEHGTVETAQWYAETSGCPLEEAQYTIATKVLNEFEDDRVDESLIDLTLCRYLWQRHLTDEQVVETIKNVFYEKACRPGGMIIDLLNRFNFECNLRHRIVNAICILFPKLDSEEEERLPEAYFEEICHRLGVTMTLDSPPEEPEEVNEPEEVMYTLPQDNSSEEYETYTPDESNEELGKLYDEQEEEYYDDECDEEEWTLADYLDEMNELADKRLAELKGEYVEEEEEEEGPYAFLGEDYEDYTLGSRSEEWYNNFSAGSASDSFTDYGVGAFGAFGYGGDGDGDGDGD